MNFGVLSLGKNGGTKKVCLARVRLGAKKGKHLQALAYSNLISSFYIFLIH